MSVSPIRWDTVPRWLTRGRFISVGWLPFLNCALAFPHKTPSPTNSPKTHFHTLRIITLSSPQKTTIQMAFFTVTNHPTGDRRPLRQGVSRNLGHSTGELGNFRIKCFSSVGPVAQRLEQRTHNAHGHVLLYLLLDDAQARTRALCDSMRKI